MSETDLSALGSQRLRGFWCCFLSHDAYSVFNNILKQLFKPTEVCKVKHRNE